MPCGRSGGVIWAANGPAPPNVKAGMLGGMGGRPAVRIGEKGLPALCGAPADEWWPRLAREKGSGGGMAMREGAAGFEWPRTNEGAGGEVVEERGAVTPCDGSGTEARVGEAGSCCDEADGAGGERVLRSSDEPGRVVAVPGRDG